MTRKHYVFVAKQIKKAMSTRVWCSETNKDLMIEREVLRTLAHSFAEEFVTDNPRFKYDLFIKACGADLLSD